MYTAAIARTHDVNKFIKLSCQFTCFNPGGGTPIHYLYEYVPPNGVVILKLLI